MTDYRMRQTQVVIGSAIGQLRQEAIWPLAVFTVSRLGLFLVVYLSLILIPLNADVSAWSSFPGNKVLEGWARWDWGWYRDIAEHGYSAIPRLGDQLNVAFFPAFPLAIRLTNAVTGNSALSAILISNLSSAASLVMLFQMIRRRYGDLVARWVVVLLATNPFSFYLSAAYSEGLFLLAAVWAFYFGERHKWALAAAGAAVASGTRAVGFTVGLGLIILYLDPIRFNWRKVRMNALWLLLTPAGLLAYMGLLWYRFQDPLLFVRARQAADWAGHFSMETLKNTVHGVLSVRAVISGDYPVVNLLHLCIGTVSVALIAAAWRRLELAHAAWAISCIAVSLYAGWANMGRYVLPVFPVFVAIPLLIKRQSALVVLTYINTILSGLLAILYSHWYWVS